MLGISFFCTWSKGNRLLDGGSNGPHYRYPCPYHFSCHKSMCDSKMIWDFPGRSWHKPNHLSKLCPWTCFILSSLQFRVNMSLVHSYTNERFYFWAILSKQHSQAILCSAKKKGGAENATRPRIGRSACQSNAGTKKGGGGYTRVGSRLEKGEKVSVKVHQEKRDSVCLFI